MGLEWRVQGCRETWVPGGRKYVLEGGEEVDVDVDEEEGEEV